MASASIPGLSPAVVSAIQRLVAGATGLLTFNGRALPATLTKADVTGTGLTNTDVGAAATSHTHTEGNVTNLTTDLANRVQYAPGGQVSVNFGVTTATTDGSGVITITHNLGTAPVAVVANVYGTTAGQWCVINSITSTTFTATIWNSAGTVNSTSRSVRWIALG